MVIDLDSIKVTKTRRFRIKKISDFLEMAQMIVTQRYKERIRQ